VGTVGGGLDGQVGLKTVSCRRREPLIRPFEDFGTANGRHAKGAGEDTLSRLEDGGENREGNLQVLCVACHRAKTGKENAQQAKTNRVKARAYGVKRKSKFANARDGKYKTKVSGETVRR